SRGTLRHLLSGQFGCLPQAIEFCYGKYGKPSVESAGVAMRSIAQRAAASDCSHGNAFNFNVSHSGELALCALGNQHRVGIDIEKFKTIQRLDSLMERCLSAQEQANVQAADKPAEAFLRRWTCKEAYLKAIGVGLSQSMKTVEVAMNPPRFVCVPDDCEEGWTLHTIAVPEGYAGALVVAGSVPVKLNQWVHPNV
ncbi:MAG: 4'-phosphopantetheinyl transferase superfamily protein, partial [Phormidesmis sp.]